jgi:methyl coenzyme M reductase subunit D
MGGTICLSRSVRKSYDREVGKWKSEAVAYTDYQKYGVYFDRHILSGFVATATRKKEKTSVAEVIKTLGTQKTSPS